MSNCKVIVTYSWICNLWRQFEQFVHLLKFPVPWVSSCVECNVTFVCRVSGLVLPPGDLNTNPEHKVFSLTVTSPQKNRGCHFLFQWRRVPWPCKINKWGTGLFEEREESGVQSLETGSGTEQGQKSNSVAGL